MLKIKGIFGIAMNGLEKAELTEVFWSTKSILVGALLKTGGAVVILGFDAKIGLLAICPLT